MRHDVPCSVRLPESVTSKSEKAKGWPTEIERRRRVRRWWVGSWIVRRQRGQQLVGENSLLVPLRATSSSPGARFPQQVSARFEGMFVGSGTVARKPLHRLPRLISNVFTSQIESRRTPPPPWCHHDRATFGFRPFRKTNAGHKFFFLFSFS